MPAPSNEVKPEAPGIPYMRPALSEDGKVIHGKELVGFNSGLPTHS